MGSFFIHNVTVFHLKDSKVTREYFRGVYFRHDNKTNLVSKGIEKGGAGTITIPTDRELNITTNDYVIEGIINEEFDLKVLIKKYQVFKVTSVEDNRKGGLKHYKIGVGE